ncbi:MAG: CBS domain-containing protein [Rhodovibrionaceae bacterium]
MNTKDIMTPTTEVVGPDTPVGDVARKMRDGDLGMLPVAENDKLIGILTDRDLAVRVLAENKGADIPAKEAMSDEVFYLYDDVSVDEAARNMGDMAVRRFPVVDREKNLVGVISLGDIAKDGQNQAAGEALRKISKAA